MTATGTDDFEGLKGSMSILSYEIGSQFYAKPTYIVDPHDFYLIPFSFRQHLQALTKTAKQLQIEELRENKIVIFTSNKPDLNEYFKLKVDQDIRGTILRVDDDNHCQIYALDYGFIEEKVNVERIFHPQYKEASEMPSLIQHCELDICAPIGPKFSNDAIEAFKFYIGNEKLSVVVKGKNAHKLKVLIYNSNPDDVSTLLALTHYTLLTPQIPHDLNAMTVRRTREPKLTFQHLVLECGEKLTVRVQSGTSLSSFYVSPMVMYKKYVQNRADFTNYCKSVPEIRSEVFEPETIVGVEDEHGLYYERAVILQASETKARVKLVDWGTEKYVPKDKVREIKTELFTMAPVSALFCAAAEGFEQWDNGLPQFLFKGYTFSITVKHVGKGFKTPHIVWLSKM